ncbi:hypothetical protein CSB09_02420 [Candidatus Gracilibacteria bacterium]|nr:MAG: hypothetical protein CSB09_02420 [Candidatus Gracilibacteria bacterium]
MQVVNPHRISIVGESNIFSLITKGGGGLLDEDIKHIENDPKLENIQTFTLIQYPVTGDFSVFSFGLESDIPVFALSGNTLDSNGVGISKKMLEYYNLQFAGSSPLFPKIDKNFIIGKDVTVTIGKSKIFNLQGKKSATPIHTKITNIHPDYPGFGIVLDRDIVERSMSEIGLSLGNPYKIIAYVKNLDDIPKIREEYKHLKVNFDQDIIRENGEKLTILKQVFFVAFCIIISIVGSIILFLLGSLLREIRHIYRLIHRLGMSGFRTHILTLGEPILLTAIGGILGGICIWLCFSSFGAFLMQILPEKGILFPLITPNTAEIWLYVACTISVLILILLYYNWNQLRILKHIR